MDYVEKTAKKAAVINICVLDMSETRRICGLASNPFAYVRPTILEIELAICFSNCLWIKPLFVAKNCWRFGFSTFFS